MVTSLNAPTAEEINGNDMEDDDDEVPSRYTYIKYGLDIHLLTSKP